MSVGIRPYESQDWDDISRIHDAARLDELRGAGLLEAYLSLADTYENEGLFDDKVWVAESGGRVVGFIAGSVGDEGGEITWIYVDPAFYRQGIGRALVEHFLARAGGPVELEVLDGNAAREFYESLGFVRTATTSGKLAGNEAFAATGHTLVWTPAPP
ncbi:GNAT family N-acetyltransferase [Microbacterium sp. B35-04]|uniref:GNAT family N-acetyltransferase n=1 Tax=unclassified Microbacterium TaxID=2609290 RepID=UPI0013D74F28|nr:MULTISPECIES: GNAT family N-acetyltransferase [unclassified Microbacterium]KAF2413457.1 GNAT family N-acetyltransferase [Microbacterium sp. B35-04]KAF2417841.1 GNAT family N-acetyltransferase [Microbacterium sp. B35-30]